MKKLKIYLDASAIGYLDEKTSPEDMNDMLALWEKIKQGKYDVAVSEVALNQIYANQNTVKVKTLVQFLSEISYEFIEINEEIEKIAALVKSNELLISDKHQNDRLHIGCAVVYGCDVLVSFNFKHLVNVRIIKGVRGISSLSGYGNIDIVTPVMLIEEGGK